ncbi:hypothetical protein V6N11_015848 [Hibiscus sabdariffa]|uniref:SS18 N-terminal domain-containing protein n=1 Tax=Hibiscus sabdariffa TaxID=183260 RepID=A0ABR2TTC8_9ROSI
MKGFIHCFAFLIYIISASEGSRETRSHSPPLTKEIFLKQPPQMIPMMPSFPTNNITTEQIQKYLDENKKLILAILDNQNLGKLAECAQYQAQLQKNLMYLAAIADAQPQATPTMAPQMAPHPAMQPGGYFMQHPQAAAMAQQPGMFPQKMPFQFNNPHQMQEAQQQQLHLQHQQAMQAQMGIRPGGPNNGMHPIQAEANLGGSSSGGPSSASGPNDGRGGNKQEGAEAGADGHGDGADEAK